MQQTSTRTAGRDGRVRPLDFLALTLVAVNVQAGMVATGPLAPVIRADLSLSNSTLGMITAIPPVAMGAAAVPGALLARRLQPSRAVTWAVALLAAGSLLRTLASGPGSLTLATIIMSVGAGLVTATFPSLAATRFAADPGLATAFYTGGTAGGALLASGLTAPVLLPLAGGSWRGAFLAWGLLAAAAWLVWWATVLRTAPAAPAGREPGNPSRAWGSVVRQGRAWLLALLFASQSATFFTMAAWIPPLFTELGLSESAASVPLLVLSIVQIPSAFLFPLAAGRTGRHRWLLLAAAAVNAVGLAGLALAPGAAPWLWGAAVGVGLGGLFSICMMLPVTLFPPAQVGAATGVMLTVGYFLASLGPLMMGALRDLSGSYAKGLLALLALTVPMVLIILGLGRSPKPAPGRAAVGS